MKEFWRSMAFVLEFEIQPVSNSTCVNSLGKLGSKYYSLGIPVRLSRGGPGLGFTVQGLGPTVVQVLEFRVEGGLKVWSSGFRL